MKNKEVISAIVGTTFFALPYVVLSVALLPSLAIGISAYGASELIMSGSKKSIAKRSLNDILNKARKENNYLIKVSKQIDNQTTTNNLIEITDTVNRIINTIQTRPDKIKSIDNFFDYYLPILLKIVRRYDEIENQNITSKDSKNFIKSADDMISKVNDSFKKLLAGIYQTDLVDGDAEMKVFNSMLRADGLSNEINIDEEE